MRINEYNSLKEFTDEYVGEWSPSNGHWFGLDFKYNGVVYRLHTGVMYKKYDTVLEDGRTALFGVYRLPTDKSSPRDYILIGQYADMDDLLDKCFIEGRKFREVIMDDSTEMLGKD